MSDHLQRFGHDGLKRFAATIGKLLRENGITFRVGAGEDGVDRPWQVSPIPLMFGQTEWDFLQAGLQQRTRLLEAILQDFLGPQHLIRDGVIPGSLLWENHVFFRAYQDVNDGAQKLHLTAADLARQSDGGWVVTGDRTRAPSGLGYLLENRIVTSRLFPQLIRRCNTMRCAAFFSDLRSHLRSLAFTAKDNPRVALLTPPDGSYREFEDAYLSRYLGLTLVQGSDLAVRGGAMYLKTLGGLLPLHVIWRHVSDRRCDPLELAPQSSEGVAGMLHAMRERKVAIVNSPGSVLVQTPALMPYLDNANLYFFGQPLMLPSAQTYWCGAPDHKQFVLDHLPEMILKPSFAVSSNRPIVASELTQAELTQLREKIQASPQDYVGQMRFEFSTAPVWSGETVVPQSMTLRTFHLVNSVSGDSEGVQVLPGALARVGENVLDLMWSPIGGNMTLDCWVTSNQPIAPHKSLIKDTVAKVELRRGGEDLPSRVAEHLFWLGRYMERAESIARLLRTTMARISDEQSPSETPAIRRLVYTLASMGQVEPDFAIESFASGLPDLETMLPQSLMSRDLSRGLQQTMGSVMRNATVVRDRLSVDAYRIIRRAVRDLSEPLPQHDLGLAIDRVATLIADLLAFAGIVNESFVRSHAWQFLELGRRIERTDSTAELIYNTLCPAIESKNSLHEAVLEITDSLMTYRSRYLNLIRLAPVVDLIVTDATNPRSLRYQTDRIADLVMQLPSQDIVIGPSLAERLAMDMHHQVRMANADQLCHVSKSGSLTRLKDLMANLKEVIPKLSHAIDARYLIHTQPTQLLTGTK